MIELREVCKTYKSKKGSSTKALNGVSLTLGEKGMTFILGKSGSGKSTLLNILGGLDKYDSGDMLIFGKSSKEFTQADWDSYRNTYVGFVFQEFNILEDYDVYQNIVLALQLQQKKEDEKEIDELLEKLELTDLKKRKVNELSGGQKQRVAIARALIKNPKIILADEPTGNLDSKTGRQVMELLQEISKEKLVVIVSHDEEYAEKYGDRIITIQDGKVVSDTNSKKEQKDEKNTYETIKSHLPFKESFKLGIGSLRYKKLKLVFTILLTVVTLGFLSCTDTLTDFQLNKAHAKLLAESDEPFILAEKYDFHKIDGMTDYIYRDFPVLATITDEVKKEAEKRIDKKGYEVYKYMVDYEALSPIQLLKAKMEEESPSDDAFYTPARYGFEAEIVLTDNLKDIVKEKIIGRAPEKENEIVISSYVAKLLMSSGVYVYEKVNTDEFQDEHLFLPKTYEEIIDTNYTYYFGKDNKVKIVGIIDYDMDQYEPLVKNEGTRKELQALSSKLGSQTEYVYNKIYANPDFIANLKVPERFDLDTRYNYRYTSDEVEMIQEGMYINPAILSKKITYFDGKNWTTTSSLKKDEVLLNFSQLAMGTDYEKDLESYYQKHQDESYEEVQKRFLANYVSKQDIIGKTLTLSVYSDSDEKTIDSFNVKIVGVIFQDIDKGYDDSDEIVSYNYYNYFSKDLVEQYRASTIQRTALLYPATTEKEFKKLLDAFPFQDSLSAKTSYSFEVYDLYSSISIIRKVTFYIGLVFVLFAICLIANFMFNSISYRKKEIGVLRALGARGRDVAKIFLWEGIVLASISGVIASILLVVVTNALNSAIMREAQLILTPFIVGIRQFIVIWVLVFTVTIIASLLPIQKISRKKPIDAILNK